MYEKVILGITTTTNLAPISKSFFKKKLFFKERGVRGVWFKKWFTQESAFAFEEDIEV
jgi:hypothetical protein